MRKKDLGLMAASYGYVYVAQVSMGANQAQYFKALKEAEEYPGPSLIIAYAPCINHGLKQGMGKTQQGQTSGGRLAQQSGGQRHAGGTPGRAGQTAIKLAVECGYWHNWRYDPRLEAEGKNPFQLDSKEPDWTKFQDFLLSEVRYSSLMKENPEGAKALFEAAEQNAKWRLAGYKRMAAQTVEAAK